MKQLAIKLRLLFFILFSMKDYNPKHKDGDEIVLLGWLIVVFSFTILYLIWHMFGYF